MFKQLKFQHTATRRWLRKSYEVVLSVILVSTHSHAKVAAPLLMLAFPMSWSFNTQPREGGCVFGPDGRLIFDSVSTHSRAEAAGKSR